MITHVFVDGVAYKLQSRDVRDSFGVGDDDAAAGSLTAPMPGKIVRYVILLFVCCVVFFFSIDCKKLKFFNIKL